MARATRVSAAEGDEQEATREAYIALCGSLTDAVVEETAALGIGSEFLPPEALAVRDGQEATPAYWAWLMDQVRRAQAEATGEDHDARARPLADDWPTEAARPPIPEVPTPPGIAVDPDDPAAQCPRCGRTRAVRGALDADGRLSLYGCFACRVTWWADDDAAARHGADDGAHA